MCVSGVPRRYTRHSILEVIDGIVVWLVRLGHGACASGLGFLRWNLGNRYAMHSSIATVDIARLVLIVELDCVDTQSVV